MRSDPTLKKWYRRINREFFHGELPANVCVRWARPGEETDIASTAYQPDSRHSYAILLNADKVPTRSIMVASIVHEMIHVATKCDDAHGPDFNLVLQQITERGILKKGALLRGITIF